MAIDVEYIDMQSSSFSPMDAFNFGKYDAAQMLNHQSGITQNNLTFSNQNPFFRDLLERDRLANYRLVSQMTMVDKPINPGKGHIEIWESFADMQNISQVNHLNILTYAPIRELLTQERISGWGYDPTSIPEEDVIGRMIESGRGWVEADGTYVQKMVWFSDDPDYTREELRKFEEQREMINLCLKYTDLDPTDTTLERF